MNQAALSYALRGDRGRTSNRPWVLLPLGSALLALAAGAIFLTCWLLGSDILASVYPDWASLKANTALGFLILGVAAWLTIRPSRDRLPVRLGMAVAVIMIGLAAITIAEYAFDWQSGLDEFLAADHTGVGDPGRMSLQTAVSFAFLGIAIACLKVDRLRVWVAMPAAVATMMISSLAILGYLYEVTDVTDFGAYTRMSLVTSVTFFLLAGGVFLSMPDAGPASLIWRASMGGNRLRARLPFLMLIPPVIGLVRHYGEVHGWFSLEVGVALMVFFIVWMLVALLIWEAHVLSKAETVNMLFMQLINGVQDYAIFTLDPKGIVSSWNEGAERMTQYTADEIVGRHILTFYPSDDLRRGTSPDDELALAARDGRIEREGWRARKDGSRFWANTLTTAMYDEEGHVSGFSRITRDLTQRRRDEEQLRRLNMELEAKVSERTRELALINEDLRLSVAELKRSNEELEQFAYVASHDLQEPLRMVGNYTQLLSRYYKGRLDEEADEFIGYAVEGAQRMQTLINDLLMFSRVGTRGQELAPVDMNEVVDITLHDLEMAIDESDATVTRDDLPMVMGDKTQLCQLMLNLIGNAIKFRGDRPPVVRVSAERSDGGWRMTVSDNGIGIAPEHQQRIFVIFQRLHARTEYPGTGIGLAVCKRIVERHGGRITVESAPNEGSRFSFVLQGAEMEVARQLQEKVTA